MTEHHAITPVPQHLDAVNSRSLKPCLPTAALQTIFPFLRAPTVWQGVMPASPTRGPAAGPPAS